MRRLIAVIALAGALSACAGQHPPPPAAPIKDWGWAYSQTRAEGAKLVYGENGTDNVPLLMLCQPHSGRVEVTVSGSRPGTVRLVSGRATANLAVRPPPGEGMDDIRVGAMRADDPALAEFARSGRLDILAEGARQSLPVRPTELPLVGRFLAACRG